MRRERRKYCVWRNKSTKGPTRKHFWRCIRLAYLSSEWPDQYDSLLTATACVSERDGTERRKSSRRGRRAAVAGSGGRGEPAPNPTRLRLSSRMSGAGAGKGVGSVRLIGTHES